MPEDAVWTAYLAERAAILRAFAAVIAPALDRADTDHPAFHGCIDWHSAVHGTYALHVVTRMTGDPVHRDHALAVAGGAGDVAAEVDALRSGRLANEVPYGAAWALHLDLEGRQAGSAAFSDLADVAADVVAAHLRATMGDTAAARASDYRSTIWATSGLLAWAAASGGGPRLAAAEASGRRLLSDPQGKRMVRGFFSPPHLMAILAMQLGLRGADAAPYAAAVAGTAPLTVDDVGLPHQGGLNFSRAWGCYAAWLMTGETSHRDDHIRLVTTQVAQPALWRDDYESFGHWVPQFGTFALAMTDPVWFMPPVQVQ